MRVFQNLGVFGVATGVAFGLFRADAAAGPGANRQPVIINFALMTDGKEVGCAAPLTNLGVGKLTAKLREARFYVYGFELIDAKGGRVPIELTPSDWQYGDVALLDFKDARGGNAPCSPTNPAKNASIVGSAPAKAYVGLEFSVGAPVETIVDGKTVPINHSNVETAPPPLDIVGMAWSWQAGRRFFALEVEPPAPFIAKPDGSKARGWMVHLGSNGCKGNPATGEVVSCAYQNRFRLSFTRFDPKTQRVELDLTRLFANTDLLVDQGGAVGCMTALDDPECPAIFAAFGLNLGESTPGAGDAGKQIKPGYSPIFSVGAAKTPKIAGSKQ